MFRYSDAAYTGKPPSHFAAGDSSFRTSACTWLRSCTFQRCISRAHRPVTLLRAKSRSRYSPPSEKLTAPFYKTLMDGVWLVTPSSAATPRYPQLWPVTTQSQTQFPVCSLGADLTPPHDLRPTCGCTR